MQVGAAAATTHVAVIAYDVTARRGAALTRGGSSYRSAQCDDATHTHTPAERLRARTESSHRRRRNRFYCASLYLAQYVPCVISVRLSNLPSAVCCTRVFKFVKAASYVSEQFSTVVRSLCFLMEPNGVFFLFLLFFCLLFCW